MPLGRSNPSAPAEQVVTLTKLALALIAVAAWAAVILDFAQVPPHMMPAMFTCGRTAGWCAHILEQKRLGKLVRPSAIYVGPDPRSPESVEGWDEVRKA